MSTTELIGVVETARLLGMSRSGVIAAANAGRIPPLGRIGQRKTFVFDRSIIAALKEQADHE